MVRIKIKPRKRDFSFAGGGPLQFMTLMSSCILGKDRNWGNTIGAAKFAIFPISLNPPSCLTPRDAPPRIREFQGICCKQLVCCKPLWCILDTCFDEIESQ